MIERVLFYVAFSVGLTNCATMLIARTPGMILGSALVMACCVFVMCLAHHDLKEDGL